MTRHDPLYHMPCDDPRADAMRGFIATFSKDTAIPADGFRRSMKALGAPEKVIEDCIEARARNLIGAKS